MKNKNKNFSCEHLSQTRFTEAELSAFSCEKGRGLEDYLKISAYPDEYAGVMRTYLVRDNDTDELVGYFSLKAGLVSLNEEENSFDTLPGIELANFAVNDNYLAHNPEMKGCGLVIFDKLIVDKILEAQAIIGAKVIYIFSLPQDDLIARYQEYGFKRLLKPLEEELHHRLKPRYDDDCIFMFQML